MGRGIHFISSVPLFLGDDTLKDLVYFKLFVTLENKIKKLLLPLHFIFRLR